MRVSRSRRVLPVLALGVAGAVAGSLVTMARPARYESHGTIVMTPAGDNAHASRLQLLFERSLGSTFGPDVDARADIAVTQTSNANEIRIAYRHADPQQAQETLQTLMSRIIEANLDVPSPPGRPGVQLKVTSPSDLPAAVSRPHLGWLAALGAAAGTLMGVVIGAVGRATRATPNS